MPPALARLSHRLAACCAVAVGKSPEAAVRQLVTPAVVDAVTGHAVYAGPELGDARAWNAYRKSNPSRAYAVSKRCLELICVGMAWQMSWRRQKDRLWLELLGRRTARADEGHFRVSSRLERLRIGQGHPEHSIGMIITDQGALLDVEKGRGPKRPARVAE